MYPKRNLKRGGAGVPFIPPNNGIHAVVGVRMLGYREIQILRILARENGGVPYWKIVMEICECKRSECPKTTCKSVVTHALRSLRKKGLIYKKRYLGRIVYYLTKEGKKFLLDLGL